jgi:hypothetical protein
LSTEYNGIFQEKNIDELKNLENDNPTASVDEEPSSIEKEVQKVPGKRKKEMISDSTTAPSEIEEVEMDSTLSNLDSAHVDKSLLKEAEEIENTKPDDSSSRFDSNLLFPF